LALSRQHGRRHVSKVFSKPTDLHVMFPIALSPVCQGRIVHALKDVTDRRHTTARHHHQKDTKKVSFCRVGTGTKKAQTSVSAIRPSQKMIHGESWNRMKDMVDGAPADERVAIFDDLEWPDKLFANGYPAPRDCSVPLPGLHDLATDEARLQVRALYLSLPTLTIPPHPTPPR
jgi:hypothetical protein